MAEKKAASVVLSVEEWLFSILGRQWSQAKNGPNPSGDRVIGYGQPKGNAERGNIVYQDGFAENAIEEDDHRLAGDLRITMLTVAKTDLQNIAYPAPYPLARHCYPF